MYADFAYRLCPAADSSNSSLAEKKTKFLCNKGNKHRFLCLLSSYLERAGCSKTQASGDADVLIVQTAIRSSMSVDTVLVGDDTDLLVLLLHHADTAGNALYFSPEPKQNSKRKRLWNIRTSKKTLGPSICSRLTQSLAATQRPGYTALGSLLPCPRSKVVNYRK